MKIQMAVTFIAFIFFFPLVCWVLDQPEFSFSYKGSVTYNMYFILVLSLSVSIASFVSLIDMINKMVD